MAGRHEMDAVDARILRALQRDSSPPVAELAAAVGLSPSACHRRVKLLEQAGIITGYAARLDRRALGLALEVFAEVSLDAPTRPAMQAFEAAVARFDEILECHRIIGGPDYLLRLVARDIDDLERIHGDCLGQLPGVARIRTLLTLSTVGAWQGYPVREPAGE
ncbi:MAG TPA: Lrp/AsnC family transcriptional regulator [Thermohalobaculum sp.]|nr:Lrp/AsnC family transcriptional regulator [Thermohalobaculum sp.]